MAKLKITLIRSTIGSIQKHVKTVEALGLKKIGASVIHDDTPQIRGMISKINHLVIVQEQQ